MSLHSKVPGLRRACQDHGVNRASPANRHRSAELLIPHIAVCKVHHREEPFRATELSLSRIKLKFMDGSVRPNFWQVAPSCGDVEVWLLAGPYPWVNIGFLSAEVRVSFFVLELILSIPRASGM